MITGTWQELAPDWYPAEGSNPRFQWHVSYDAKYLIAQDTDPKSGKFFLYKIIQESINGSEVVTQNLQLGMFDSFEEAASKITR